MDKPYKQKATVAVSLPQSFVPLSELIDSTSAINDTVRSGKVEGAMVRTIDGDGNHVIAIATGSHTTDHWDIPAFVSASATLAYAEMAITQRDNLDPDPLLIPVIPNTTGTINLLPPANPVPAGSTGVTVNNYVQVTASLEIGQRKNMSITGNGEFLIELDGLYTIPSLGGTFSIDANNATIAFAFAIERAGFLMFTPRFSATLQALNGKHTTMNSGGQVAALAGDKLSIWVSSDSIGNVNISNSLIQIWRMDDLIV